MKYACFSLKINSEWYHVCIFYHTFKQTILKEKTFGVEKFSYDAFEERVHIRLLLDQDNHTTYRDTLLLYKEV